jgi:hypothetical protein
MFRIQYIITTTVKFSLTIQKDISLNSFNIQTEITIIWSYSISLDSLSNQLECVVSRLLSLVLLLLLLLFIFDLLFFNWRNSIRRCLVWFNKSDNFNSILYIDNKLMFILSADIINLDNNTHIRIDRRRHYHHHHHHRYFPFYYLTFV